MDPGAGPDKHNEVVTATKAQFMKAWKGNVLAEKSVVDAVVQASPTTARILSTSETQQIRGAFFVFLIPIAIAIFSGVGAAIAGIAATVGTIAAGVGAIVGSVIATMGSVIAGIGSLIGSLATTLFTGITAGFTSLFGAIGGSSVLGIGGAASGGLVGGFGGGLVGTLAQSAITIGLNLAVTKGLEALGVNATISNLIGSFVTGGLSSGFKLGFSASNLFVGGLKGVALTGSQTLLQKVGLDAQLSSTLSLITSPFIDGIQQGNIGGQLVKIVPSLTQNLALYGVGKLSESFGIDPLIGKAFALPFLAQNPLGGTNLGTMPVQDLIIDSLVHGGLEFGMKWAAESLTENPFFQALSRNLFTEVLSIALGEDGSLVDHVKSFLVDTSSRFLGALQSGGYTRLIEQEGGALNALESVATDVLNRRSIEEIHNQGGIANLVSGRAVWTTVEGERVKEVQITANDFIYLSDADELRGVKTIDSFEFGRYELNLEGKLVLAKGKAVYNDSGSNRSAEYDVNNGSSIQVTYGSEGKPMIRIVPQVAFAPVAITPEGISTGMYILPSFNMDLGVSEMALAWANMNWNFVHSRPPLSFIPNEVTIRDVGDPVDLLLMNGVSPEWFTNKDTIPSYFDPEDIDSFVGTLIRTSAATEEEIDVLNLFTGWSIVPDLSDWHLDAEEVVQNLTHRVRDRLDEIHDNQTTAFTALAYSGAGQPLLKAIDALAMDDTWHRSDNVILVGSPLYDSSTEISNPWVKSVINVFGEKDIFYTQDEAKIKQFLAYTKATAKLAEKFPQAAALMHVVETGLNLAGVITAGYELLFHGDVRGIGDFVKSTAADTLVAAVKLMTGVDLYEATSEEMNALNEITSPGDIPIIRNNFHRESNVDSNGDLLPALKVYNIQLKGVSHTDYFVEPEERASLKPDNIKLKAEKFLANVAKFSSENELLGIYLERATYVNGIYYVDPNDYY